MKLSLMVEGGTKIALLRRELCTRSLARILHLRISDKVSSRRSALYRQMVVAKSHAIVSKSEPSLPLHTSIGTRPYLSAAIPILSLDAREATHRKLLR